MLDWNDLLSGQRRKDKHGSGSTVASANGRIELERDYDRILFATPTRRMADKTQVFPLERNDSVRNRLTHSHEVSSLARSIGIRLAFDYGNELFPHPEQIEIVRCVPALLSAIGLVHDLGNPPFGHQGETAIQAWFKRKQRDGLFNQCPNLAADFTRFDGNAQTFRLVTKLQILNDSYGLNLTYATLASMLKYPASTQDLANTKWKKHGFYLSEQDIVEDVWQETGLSLGIRHPFTYIMEACDDIAYSVLDAEDIVKKGFASFSDIIDHLETHSQDDEVTNKVIGNAKNKNTEFKQASLSPKELNDVSMQMFRVYAISAMVDAVVSSFVEQKDFILSGQANESYDLISASKAHAFCSAMKAFDKAHGYNHKSVLELELKGNNYISNMMDMLWQGIEQNSNSENTRNADLFSKYAYQRISENYRRAFEQASNDLPSDYRKAQLLVDAVSGMTDSYLIQVHDELSALNG
ncbi:dNTP triphosphohydrolase [Catenovulum sp. SM1970]|uniref:deoxyguanosinetriphosphate triphosphohydrolase family protein n=1 Tax=Marinifaba aquimaris TaxID=2741323 RepID=UPI0015746CB7|nr:dNTP triphosphohydrolase [Marinifaba aquimaris]NTS77425.1 dNTP triphosphohydrolase [Marinifaba aquimaris]